MEDNQKGNFGLKSPEKEVYRVRVSKDWRNDPKFDSILVKPFYQIIVHDQGEFLEKGQIMVKGLVRKGGTFEYKPQMTLKDAIYEAGGIKIESDFSKIEVSRILDVENTNGEIVPLNVKTISVSIRQDWQSDPQLEGIKLLPFDQIFIRPNPEFKMQQSVFVDGEVLVPGEYIKSKVDLRISDLVAMSGGLTKLSYPEGAYLTRPSYGQITIALRNAIEKPGSIYDIKLQEGDVLTVPVLSEIVSVKGNVFKPNANFLFEPSRRNAKYYINMAGGFETKTIKRKVVVTYPNGRVKKAKTFFFFLHKYPKVTQGAIVDVPKREDKELTELDTERKFALKERINEIIATTTSIITLLVLIKAASK
jgi:protein involved in polysaccharide export with SLBB domain